jgi:hypothetical protein
VLSETVLVLVIERNGRQMNQDLISTFRPTYDPILAHPKVAAPLAKIQAGVQSGPFRDDWDSLSQYEIPQW